ncbi:MAG: putative aminoglycoside phosphotransferase, partial [Actinoallomurus sp.]|nr:putative aminoglycoside phosphotransferase [Actinoallomurus sp.]
MTAALTEHLTARLTAVYGRPVEVTGLRRLSGGASRETWSFDAEGRPLILRRDPPVAPQPAELAREAAALTVAARGGVPVARLIDHGDGTGTIG